MNTHLLQGPSITRSISLPEALDAAIQERAKEEDRSISRLIRRAVIAYLQEDDQKAGDDDGQTQNQDR